MSGSAFHPQLRGHGYGEQIGQLCGLVTSNKLSGYLHIPEAVVDLHTLKDLLDLLDLWRSGKSMGACLSPVVKYAWLFIIRDKSHRIAQARFRNTRV